MVENRFQNFIRTILENNYFAFDPLYCLRLGKKNTQLKKWGILYKITSIHFEQYTFVNFGIKSPDNTIY